MEKVINRFLLWCSPFDLYSFLLRFDMQNLASLKTNHMKTIFLLCFLVIFSLIQENEFDRDPVSCMVIGLTFHQLWYSSVPKEMLLTDSEQVAVSLPAIDNTNSQEAVTDYPCNSDSSIKNERISSMEIGDRLHEENSMGVNVETGKLTQNFQPQGFYANSTDDTGNEGSIFNFGDRFQYASNFSALGEYLISLSFIYLFLFQEKYSRLLDH